MDQPTDTANTNNQPTTMPGADPAQTPAAPMGDAGAQAPNPTPDPMATPAPVMPEPAPEAPATPTETPAPSAETPAPTADAGTTGTDSGAGAPPAAPGM